MVHPVRLGVVEDGLGHVRRLQHVEGRASGCQRQRPRPVLQFQQPLDVAVARGVVEGGLRRDAPRLEHMQAGEPRPGSAREDLLRLVAQRRGQGVGGAAEVDRDGHDGGGVQLGGAGEGLRRLGAQAAAQHGQPAIPARPVRPRGQSDLFRVAQVEGELRRARVAQRGLHLEAAQDHLLQPGRDVGALAARRRRVAPEPALHALEVLRFPEGQVAGRELVQQRAQGEDVAARVMADAQRLLGRHVGHGAVGQAEFLRHQVRQLVVMREAVVDQHRLPRRAEQDVGGLHVEMDDMLAMQGIERIGDRRTDARDLLDRQRRLPQAQQQRRAFDPFHHDVGRRVEAGLGDEARYMRAGQARHDHLLHLEGDDGRGVLAFAQAGHLHQHGRVVRRAGNLQQHRHAAFVQDVADGEAVHHLPRQQRAPGHQRPTKSRSARLDGRPAARILAAAAAMS